MTKRIAVQELHAFCSECLVRAGLRREHAQTVAEVLVTTDTWGTFSHGTGALKNYLVSLRAGGMDAKATPEVMAEGDSWTLIDAHAGMGMPACSMAMEKAIVKARSHAISWAGVRNSNHYGAAGYYAYLAVREDMIGISMSNTDPNMVVPGGRGPILGNNPLAYGVPAGDEYPILLDIALSAVAAGKIIAMKALDQPIPSTWLTDADGLPASEVGDWPASGAMQPMAGHKGYGLAMLIEIMAGLLPGASLLDEAKSWILNPSAHGGLGQAFVVIHPAAILPIEDFKSRVDAVIRKIRGAPKAKGAERIYLPGEIEWERRDDALANGIALPEYVVAALHDAAKIAGVDAAFLNEQDSPTHAMQEGR